MAQECTNRTHLDVKEHRVEISVKFDNLIDVLNHPCPDAETSVRRKTSERHNVKATLAHTALKKLTRYDSWSANHS